MSESKSQVVGVRINDPDLVAWLNKQHDHGPPKWRNLSRNALIVRIVEEAKERHP